MTLYFCALCTEPTSTQHMEPLGKGGAMVNVCADCTTVHPRSGRYTFAEGGPRKGLGAGNRSRGKNRHG